MFLSWLQIIILIAPAAEWELGESHCRKLLISTAKVIENASSFLICIEIILSMKQISLQSLSKIMRCAQEHIWKIWQYSEISLMRQIMDI